MILAVSRRLVKITFRRSEEEYLSAPRETLAINYNTIMRQKIDGCDVVKSCEE